MAFATLDGINFVAEPEDIQWDFQMKIKETKTLGGKVIQVLGATLSDMRISGRFGSGRKGDGGEAWPGQYRFRNQIIRIAKEAENNPYNPTPVRFRYPPRNWDFNVWVKSFTETTFDNADIAPKYTLVLNVDEERAGEIVKGVKDLYLKRLVDGVGWKQSNFNGPEASQVQGLLAGKTVGEYLASLAQEAFESGLPGGQIGLEER